MTTSYHDLLGWSPEAVVLDCEGTLMDTERHWQEARSRAPSGSTGSCRRPGRNRPLACTTRTAVSSLPSPCTTPN